MGAGPRACCRPDRPGGAVVTAPLWPPLSRGGPNPGDPMTNLPEPGDRARALGLLEAAEFMRDAHFRDGLTVQEITTALAHTVDPADALVGSLARDGFGAVEIAEMLSADAPAVSSAVVAPPTDQTALRDRIAEALVRYDWNAGLSGRVTPSEHHYGEADAVLAVLPEPVDRAAAWLDAAAECNKAGGTYAEHGARVAAGAAFALMETFLRKAGEAGSAATPCSGPVPCEDGGEPCDTHERLMGHIEGDHELCKPDCGDAWQRRLADECPQCGTTGACNGGPCPLRRMADETATTEVVPCVRPEPHPAHSHSGLRKGTAVHGRCPGVPAAGARQDEPVVTVHAAPDLSPAASEALGALVDVAKQQAACDFEHPHPEHPCGRRTTAARPDGAQQS